MNSKLIQFQTALRLFNSEHYYECHDILEELWMEEESVDLKNITWAIIQVAIALYHAREKNVLGTFGMLKKAVKKIEAVSKENVMEQFPNELVQMLDWGTFSLLVTAVFQQSENNNSCEFIEAELKKFKFNV